MNIFLLSVFVFFFPPKVSFPELHITTFGFFYFFYFFFAGITPLRTKPMGRTALSAAELQRALKIILAHTWGQLCFSVVQSSSSLN